MENSGKIEADALLTSHQVGSLIQADPSSIQNWVARGWLKAFRTPGGHRRIRARDLAAFLAERGMPIPPSLSFKRRLMVVDDQPRELRGLERLLSSVSNELVIRTLTNGIDALIEVGTFRPDLIVLDVYMPPVNGLEVLERLKANTDTRHISVIVATGRWSEDLDKRALAAGAMRCVPKPIEPKLILDALEIGHGAALAS